MLSRRSSTRCSPIGSSTTKNFSHKDIGLSGKKTFLVPNSGIRLTFPGCLIDEFSKEVFYMEFNGVQ